MRAWTSRELDTISDTDELRIATARLDGTLRGPVIIWVVSHGDDVYVRSVNGRESAWFRGAQTRHEGRVSVGSVEEDVAFEELDRDLDAELDAAYRDKYSHYSTGIVNTILTREAQSATLRLVPMDETS